MNEVPNVSSLKSYALSEAYIIDPSSDRMCIFPISDQEPE